MAEEKKSQDEKRYMSKIVRELNKLIVKTMREEGIGTGEIDLIHTVRHHPGITQKEIVALLNIDKGAMARRVANLEKKGYLVRQVNPEDKRSQQIFATEKAEALKGSKTDIEATFFDWLYDGLSVDDQIELARMMRILYVRSKTESRSGFPNVTPKLKEDMRDGTES